MYWELENQADVFAGNFLAPPILINEKLKMLHSSNTPYLVGETFKISEKAVYNRYKDFDVWKSRNVVSYAEEMILQRCKDSVCFVRCQKCNAEIVIDNPESFDCNNFICKYCGNNKFSYTRNGIHMVYKGIDMDENNKAITCPVCQNERIIPDGDFCQICGTKLINECSETFCSDENVYKPPCGKG